MKLRITKKKKMKFRKNNFCLEKKEKKRKSEKKSFR